MARLAKPKEVAYTEQCEHPLFYPGEPQGQYDMLGWDAWATEMSRTHVQEKCPHCNLWTIWVEISPSEIEDLCDADD